MATHWEYLVATKNRKDQWTYDGYPGEAPDEKRTTATMLNWASGEGYELVTMSHDSLASETVLALRRPAKET